MASGQQTPKRKLAKKVTGFLARWGSIVLAGSLLCGGAAVATRDSSLKEITPQAGPPSLEELNLAITQAEEYLNGLFKSLGDGKAVQSEYYGLPIRAFFQEQKKWVLLGEEATQISPLDDTGVDERYKLSFGDDMLVVSASVLWSNTEYLTVSVHPEKVDESVSLWLGSHHLANFSPGSPALMATMSFSKSERATLQSLRYTVRHASQEAYLYWQAKGDAEKANQLSRFLQTNNFEPGFDMRAIIFNRSRHLPDDLPFNAHAYDDCEHLPQGNELAYPYESKACKLLQAYLGAGERDPFLQAAKALHQLQRYGPQHPYQDTTADNWWGQSKSPVDAAVHLRKQWQRTSVGIPSCTPLSCTSTASSIRTFTHGTLELEIARQLGDETAMRFADAAANSAVAVQIKSDGIVHMLSGPAYRPAHIGSFPVYWDDHFRFVPPKAPAVAGAALLATGQTAMPPEYLGILPSNSESTFDGWAFLVRYRCVKYHTNCIL